SHGSRWSMKKSKMKVMGIVGAIFMTAIAAAWTIPRSRHAPAVESSTAAAPRPAASIGSPVEGGKPESILRLEREAQAGSPQAMFLLANAYRYGALVPVDNRKALELYERAADLEHAESLQALAMAYENGELDLDRDEEKFRLYSEEALEALEHRKP